VQLRDEAPDLRRLERGEALLARQPEQRVEVAAVDLEAAPREAPLVLERAQVFADDGGVRMRGVRPSR